MAKRLRLTLLGGGQISLEDAAPLALQLAKMQALLFYLAVDGRTSARSLLTDLLWSELAAGDGQRNLRVTLSALRRQLGDYLHITRNAITFVRDAPYWLDVEQFQVQTARAAAFPSQALSPAVAAQVAEALALYQGEFLAGFAVANAPRFEEWVLTERERLRQRALLAGELLLDYYLAANADPLGIALAQRLLVLEPWQERIHRQLIQLLARNGQRAAALQQYELCRRWLAEGLGVAPEPETTRLYEQLRLAAPNARTSAAESAATSDTGHPPAQETPIPPHNLPAPTSSFVGRQAELAQIAQLLADPTCRLVTLLGVGGVGKTRLALQVAQQQLSAQAERWQDGVFFVPLAAVESMSDAIPLIAGLLGFSFSGALDPASQLINYLQHKRMLLLLDNCEQLVKEAALLGELLQGAADLKLLVTSRARLGLYEEWLVDVEGLATPPLDPASVAPSIRLEMFSAVDLFAQRARRVRLNFDLSAEIDAVVQICRLVEGMPLGIELAAGWVRSYDCASIAQSIQRDLGFLVTPLQNLPSRHRSLRAVFDHSWRLLPPQDGALLQRLVVFHGGFDAAAASVVASAGVVELARLADCSLLQQSPTGRYAIHELLRQYAGERIAPQDWWAVRVAHCRYFARYVADQWPRFETGAEALALTLLRAEYDNIRTGWQAAIELASNAASSEQLVAVDEPESLIRRYAPGLAYFLVRECRYREGRQLMATAEAALLRAGWDQTPNGHPPGGKQVALALVRSWLADFLYNLSQYTAVESLLEPAIVVLRANGALAELADALTRMGRAYLRMGRYAQAEATLQEALQSYQAAGEGVRLSMAINTLGIVYSNQDRFAEAKVCYEHCLAIHRAADYPRGVANMLSNLGSNEARGGRYQTALTLYQQAYRIAQSVGEALMMAIALSNLGSVRRALGHLDEAQSYLEQSIAHCRAIGERRWTAASLNLLALTLLEQGNLATAQLHVHEALRIAQQIESIPDQLDSLAYLGEILAQRGAAALAYAICAQVAQHPVAQSLARQRSTRLCEGLRPALAPAELAAANAKANSLSALVAQALAASQ
jgi:predicted ATPase/DNA-binding SARP family transcriptional activator/Tfp pilus assembly protein PilF